jgi:hypothetical protein
MTALKPLLMTAADLPIAIGLARPLITHGEPM